MAQRENWSLSLRGLFKKTKDRKKERKKERKNVWKKERKKERKKEKDLRIKYGREWAIERDNFADGKKKRMLRRCQFHQHFTCGFCADILAPQKYKPKM